MNLKGTPKIRIITRRAGYNFGSSLQAYAIQRVVEKLGYPNQILDYDESSSKPLWRIRPFLQDIAFQILRTIPLSGSLFKRKYQELRDRDVQIKKFKKFEAEHLKLTAVTYRSADTLSKAMVDCDICICGSDQIWSPLFFDPVMFLDFCKGTPVRTVAYAPSFGVSELHLYRAEIRDLIQRLDRVSVRECEGAQIILELTGLDVPVVLDPTLLLERGDWRALSRSSQPSKPYILCYFLGQDRIPHKFLSELKHATGWDLVNVCTFRSKNDIEGAMECNMSPEEFLGAVENASFVCTDSFHGTIFSLLFECEFFTFERFGKERTGQNSRIYTLLNRHTLTDRLKQFDQGYDSTMMQPIDFEAVRSALQSNRNESLRYLELALTTDN